MGNGGLDREFDHVHEEVDTRTEFERAIKAMGAFTPLQREAISVAYFDGFSDDEIAELLGIPVSTLKTRL